MIVVFTCARLCWLGAWIVLDFEDVVAERCLHGPAEHALLGREDSFAEGLLLLALDDPLSSPPVLLLVGSIDLPLATLAKLLPDSISLLGLLGRGFGLGEYDPQVAPFGLAVLGLVFVVVLGRRPLRSRSCGALVTFSWIFVESMLSFTRSSKSEIALPGGGQEFLEFGFLGELLLLELVEVLRRLPCR